MTFTTSSPPQAHASTALFSSNAVEQLNKTSARPTAPAAASAEQVAADNAQRARAGSCIARELRTKLHDTKISIYRHLPKFALELRTKFQDSKISSSRKLPEAEQSSASRLAMEGMQQHSAGEFRQQIHTWIKSYKHLSVDTSHLHTYQANILLDELSKAKSGSIKTLDLPIDGLNVSMEKLTSALKTIRARNPASKLTLSFFGRKMTASEGEILGKSLADIRLASLSLDATQGHEGMSAALAMIPTSGISMLRVNGFDVSRFERDIIEASPKLDKLVLNKSVTADVAKDSEAKAKHTEAMERIVTAVRNEGKTVETTDTALDREVTENDLENSANIDMATFKEKVTNAFNDHQAVMVDLYYAAKEGGDPERQKALVQEMATNAAGHLQLVDVRAWDLPDMKDGLGKDIMTAMKSVSRNHPQVKLSANFLRTPFIPEDADALAEALPLAKIRILTLDGCGIKAAGTAKIAEALKHTPGAVVDMCKNEFDGEGVRHLASALPTLRSLTLSPENFSELEKSNLDAVANKCDKKIIWETQNR